VPTGVLRLNTSVIDAQENREIADKLRQAADLLEAQGANPFRAAAYRKAADTIARLTRPAREIFDAEGLTGLDALPHIGKGIAAAIAEILITGRWNQLERLRGPLTGRRVVRGRETECLDLYAQEGTRCSAPA